MDPEYFVEFNSLHNEYQTAREYIIWGIKNRACRSDGRLQATISSDESNEVSNSDISSTSPLYYQTHLVQDDIFSFSGDGKEDIMITKRKPIPQKSSKMSSESSLSKITLNTFPTIGDGPSSRKWHKKSRQGCFNCKRRKIKCQETQPECENCIKIKHRCLYPAPKTLSQLQKSTLYSQIPITSINLQATPITFTLTDMRLFHHFLQEAYPHLPVGNAATWTTQVPLIAHHNPYVMHAILGMASTHLSLITGTDLSTSAFYHRQLAIKGSNDALGKIKRSGCDSDALLATCYLLAFQSSYMPDGMQEFFRIIRGCFLLHNQFRIENVPMAFFLPHACHFDFMQERLLDLPMIDSALIQDTRRSVVALLPILKGQMQIEFHHHMIDTIDNLTSSPLKAYFKFLSVYQILVGFNSESFENFLDPTNFNATILLINFLAIELIMDPILNREYDGRGRVMHSRYHLDWIFSAYREWPPHLKNFIEWPNSMARSLGGVASQGFLDN